MSQGLPSTARESFLIEDHDAYDNLPLPVGGDAAAVLAAALNATLRGERVVLATVVRRKGSAPSTPGQKLVYASDGTCVGTIGGGAVERRVLSNLVARCNDEGRQDAARDESAELTAYKLGASLGMCCGGVVEVMFETITRLTPVVLVGAGHIGSAAAPLLAQCGFVVTMADERPEWIERASASFESFGPRIRCVADEFEEAARPVSRRGALITMTHDHQLDQRVVEWALKEGFAYVGGVGSRAKAARTRTRLLSKGFGASDIGRVHMPVGADIGARQPNEIAVAIVAELIAWRSQLHESSMEGATHGE